MAEQVKSVIVPNGVSSAFITSRQVIDALDLYRSGVLIGSHGSLAQPTAACYLFLTRVAPETKAMPLTVKQIEAATFGRSKKRLGDGSGLFLRLYSSGSKIFQVLLPAEAGIARRVWVSVGDFPATTLKEARERASSARLQSARGWSAERIRAAVRCDLEDIEVRRSEGSSKCVGSTCRTAGTPKVESGCSGAETHLC